MLDLRIDAPNLSTTQALAKALAPALKAGDCLLLSGDLGAGKSAFSRAIIQSIAGADVEVPSPTYTLVQAYELPTLRIFHYDLYRIGEPDEVYELDWQEARHAGLCLVEWPSRLEHLTPSDALNVSIRSVDEHARHFHLTSTAPDWSGRLAHSLI